MTLVVPPLRIPAPTVGRAVARQGAVFERSRARRCCDPAAVLLPSVLPDSVLAMRLTVPSLLYSRRRAGGVARHRAVGEGDRARPVVDPAAFAGAGVARHRAAGEGDRAEVVVDAAAVLPVLPDTVLPVKVTVPASL